MPNEQCLMSNEQFFKHAIVRTPCQAMIHGLTSAGLGIQDFGKALLQHNKYIKALEECGLKVTVLEPDERYPDSTLVEDLAVCTSKCVIINKPGAPSRRGETTEMK